MSTISDLAEKCAGGYSAAARNLYNIAAPVVKRNLPAFSRDTAINIGKNVTNTAGQAGRALANTATQTGRALANTATQTGRALANTATQTGRTVATGANKANQKYVIPGIKHVANRPADVPFRPVRDTTRAVFNPHIGGYSVNKAVARTGLAGAGYKTVNLLADSDSRLPVDPNLLTPEQKAEYHAAVMRGAKNTLYSAFGAKANPIDRQAFNTAVKVTGNKLYNMTRDYLINANNAVPLPKNKLWDTLYRGFGTILPEATPSSEYGKQKMLDMLKAVNSADSETRRQAAIFPAIKNVASSLQLNNSLLDPQANKIRVSLANNLLGSHVNQYKDQADAKLKDLNSKVRSAVLPYLAGSRYRVPEKQEISSVAGLNQRARNDLLQSLFASNYRLPGSQTNRYLNINANNIQPYTRS